MRSDSFATQVLGNLARTSPPFAPGEAQTSACSSGSGARPFRSWLLHALAFAPVSDDTSHRDEMRVSPQGADRPATAHARTARSRSPSRTTQRSPGRGASTPPASADLFALARRGLETAQTLDGPLRQYAAIHLAAMRAAAAVVAARKRPEHRLGRRARIRGTWDVLPEVAPEFAEFAAYFDRTTIKRVRAEAGIAGAVDIHELEDLRLMTTRFVRKVEALDEVKNATTEQTRDTGDATAMRRTS